MARLGPLALALVLQTSRALDLNTPPPFFAGDKVFQLSWTTSPGDPAAFNLWALCDNIQPFMLSSAVQTDTSPYSTQVNPDIFEKLTHPISCVLQAKSLDGNALLASTGSFQVNPGNPPETSPPATQVPPSKSPQTSATSTPTAAPAPTDNNFTSTDATPTETTKSHTASTSISSGDPLSIPTKFATTFSSSAADPSSPPSGTSTSAGDIPPAATNLSLAHSHKSSVGAIVGGVIGTANPRAPSLTPTSLEKNDWLVTVDGAMAEAAKQTERARSRTGTYSRRPGASALGLYDMEGYQSPDPMHAPVQREFQPELLAAAMPEPTRMYVEDEREKQADLYTGHPASYSESAGSATGVKADMQPGGGLWRHPDGLNDLEKQSANDSTDITQMDEETRERRRAEILEKMRRVLDGQQGPKYHDVAF
ncbi:hypothetical protein LshimejAT787_0211390 [Lyophyllum shimeji]|uniref:Uncharacterized protein n=1 Tax=Lyophyllum shimeji TaxID=47721 RepID=A0A9P3UII7_LYOSH|nr:hypothetical protein LshimejAT787_0211390 [Lyophyllum shimeji]